MSSVARALASTCGVVALLFVASVSAPARAQDAAPSERDVAAAHDHYEAAVSYYEQLRYDEAAREFREAYRLSRRAHLLKNVATSLQHARRWAESADVYAEYLTAAPDAEDREAVEARIARLRELAEGEARGEQTHDEDVPEAAPLESQDGTSRAAPAGGGMGGVPVAPVVLLATGGAFGIAALVTGLLAHDVYNDLDGACTFGACDSSRAGDRDRGQTLAIASTVLTGAAIVVGVIGVVIRLVSGGDDEPTESPVAVGFDCGGASMLFRGAM